MERTEKTFLSFFSCFMFSSAFGYLAFIIRVFSSSFKNINPFEYVIPCLMIIGSFYLMLISIDNNSLNNNRTFFITHSITSIVNFIIFYYIGKRIGNISPFYFMIFFSWVYFVLVSSTYFIYKYSKRAGKYFIYGLCILYTISILIRGIPFFIS